MKMLENGFLWIYQLEDDAQNFQFINGRFTTIPGHFFVNYTNFFHKTVILRCLTCLGSKAMIQNFLVTGFLQIDEN